MAKFEAVVMAIFGFFVGIFIAVVQSIFNSFAAGMGQSQGFFGGLGYLAIIIAPLFYGAIGFVLGALIAFIYNIIAKWIGGIELELEP